MPYCELQLSMAKAEGMFPFSALLTMTMYRPTLLAYQSSHPTYFCLSSPSMWEESKLVTVTDTADY